MLTIILLSILQFFTSPPSLPQSLTSLSAEKPESTWKRVTGKGEEFSVLMPGAPSVYFNVVTSGSATRRLERIYSSYSKGSVYLAVSYDLRSSRDVLESFKEHHLYKGELTFERDISVDGYEGKQYKLKYGGGSGKLQIHVTRHYGYAVAIIQAVDDLPLTQYFFSSLSLEPAGIVKNPLEGPPLNQASNLPQAGKTETPFAGKDVTRKATVVSKPEPSLTNEARDSRTGGTVVLHAVLSASGEVTIKEVVRGLGSGLTENAVDAAQNIKFIPAVKDGRFVSQYVQWNTTFVTIEIKWLA